MTVHLYIEENTITTELRKVMKESTHGDQLQKLDQMIQWIRGYHDPFVPYMTQSIETSNASTSHRVISAGLTRIAYEAGAILDFYVSEDNILKLYAITNPKYKV